MIVDQEKDPNRSYPYSLMTNASETEISTVLDWRRVDLEEKGIELERVPCDQETDCSS